jgi:hypothetical protein
MIDTHRIFKRLAQAGVSETECEALVETARELSDAPTKADLHALETSFVKWMVASLGFMTAILLGAMYYVTSDIKADVREIRNRVAELWKQP